MHDDVTMHLWKLNKYLSHKLTHLLELKIGRYEKNTAIIPLIVIIYNHRLASGYKMNTKPTEPSKWSHNSYSLIFSSLQREFVANIITTLKPQSFKFGGYEI